MRVSESRAELVRAMPSGSKMFYKVKDQQCGAHYFQQCEVQLHNYTIKRLNDYTDTTNTQKSSFFIFTSSFFFAMQKKCITFAVANNFIVMRINSKREKSTATLCITAYGRYWSVNECYPPPINFHSQVHLFMHALVIC